MENTKSNAKRLRSEENNSNSSNEKRTNIWEEIEGTPLHTIHREEQEDYLLSIGTQVISQKTFKTREAAIRYAKTKPWDLIMGAIWGAIALNNKIKFNLLSEEKTEKTK